MFHLSGLPALDPYKGSPPQRDPHARWVRTLPMLDKVCSLRAFAELWTVVCSRPAKTFSDDDEKETEPNSDNQKKRKRRRRNGEAVLQSLPYPVVVVVCQYLQHTPVCAFASDDSSSSSMLCELVEDMHFDLDRVVNFYLRLSVNGFVIPNSRLFLNPNMTIGISWGQGGDKGDGDEDTISSRSKMNWTEEVPCEGVALFDPPLTRMKTTIAPAWGRTYAEFRRVR